MLAVRAQFDAKSRRADDARRAGWRQRTRAVALVTSAMSIVFVSMLAPRSARADEPASPPPIAVRTFESVHEGCPTGPSFAARLTDRLARIHEASETEPAVRVEIRVERTGDLSHGRLALAVGDERAERDATSPSCEEVLAALAVMAAIGLDQGTLPTPSLPEARPPRRERDVPPVVPAPLPETSLWTHPTVRFGTGVEVSANRATVIVPTLFGEVGLRSKYAPSLRLGAGRSFSQSFATRRGTASTRWSEVRFDACVTVLRRPEPLRLGPCISGEVGRIDTVVEAPLPFRSKPRWWVTTGASARLSWRVHPRMSLELEGGARVPVLVDRLFFEPDTVVYVPPALVPFAGAAFVSHFR